MSERWRTQTHTVPAQVGGRVEFFGLGRYPGPIAYLSLEAWGDEVNVAPHVGLLPAQVDALINALEDARALFREWSSEQSANKPASAATNQEEESDV